MPSLPARGEFTQMPAEFAHPERHAYAFLRKRLAIRTQYPRALIEAACGQRDIGSDADIAGGDVLYNPLVGGIRPLRHNNVAQERIGRGPETAIADDGDSQIVPCCYLFDFCLYRAGIAVNKYLNGRTSRRCYAAASDRFARLAAAPG